MVLDDAPVDEIHHVERRADDGSVPHKDCSDLYEKMIGKGKSAGEAHRSSQSSKVRGTGTSVPAPGANEPRYATAAT